jgi:hypothetical protein
MKQFIREHISILLILVIAITGISYVIQITSYDTKAYTIAKLYQRRDVLLAAQQDLTVKAANDQSIRVLRNEPNVKIMVVEGVPVFATMPSTSR